MRTRTAQEIWDAALGELQLQVSKANYRTWLEKTRGSEYQDKSLIVTVPNVFVCEYLDKTLRSLIEKTLIGIVQSEISVCFMVDVVGHTIRTEKQFEGRGAFSGNGINQKEPIRLNSRYTFDKFVVSNCNRLAYAAAMGAAEKPGLSSYNPLYIYGGVGLGKTHLLNALGHAAYARNMRVIFVSAEQFTNEFISAIRERKTDDFRSRYRSAEMLLIDDIQFISGKEQTEESFFHIFNELRDADKQIALTSNCPPQSIPAIGDRLRSRLEWGLTAGVQPPDYETRLAILQSKATKEEVMVTPDILEFIAGRAQANIRELEGSLNRVVAYARLLNIRITPEVATQAMEDIAERRPKVVLTPKLLLQTVADYFQMDIQEIKGTKRDKLTTLARQIAMYLMRSLTDCSLSRIGGEIGGRQPILVSHACKKISDEMQNNPDINLKVMDIKQKLS